MSLEEEIYMMHGQALKPGNARAGTDILLLHLKRRTDAYPELQSSLNLTTLK
jgi:hypothetical protein